MADSIEKVIFAMRRDAVDAADPLNYFADRLAALPKPELREDGDWYTTDHGSHCVDFDLGKSRQLSILLKPDGSVAFAMTAYGASTCGNAMDQWFKDSMTKMFSPPPEIRMGFDPGRDEGSVEYTP